jgi:hypothetical protein
LWLEDGRIVVEGAGAEIMEKYTRAVSGGGAEKAG